MPQQQIQFTVNGVIITAVALLEDTPDPDRAEITDGMNQVLNRPDEPSLGAGEAAQGPATGAVANAVARATGERVRSLPVRSA